jgi:hypothetical protein
MAEEQQPSRSLDDLLAEFKVLSAEADEVRRKMKELIRQIEARGGSYPGKSSHEIVIPKGAT